MGRYLVNIINITVHQGCHSQALGDRLLSRPRPNVKPRFVDLFCGIGSFHVALSEAGCRCVMACDISKHARSFYEENYSMSPRGDISEIDPYEIEDFEILCAGFPCQCFSLIGNRKGFSDALNGGMFNELMRFVVAKLPQVIILENVEGLLKHDNGEAMKYIVSTLENLSYKVDYRLLCCSDFGIPQLRKRVFIVGLHKTAPMISPLDKIFEMDQLKHSCSLSQFLNVPLVKTYANTIRIGGRQGMLLERSWSRYVMADGEVYELTLEDGIRLQGFEGKTFRNTSSQIWISLGNTIPTVFTRALVLKLFDIIDINSLRSSRREIGTGFEQSSRAEGDVRYTPMSELTVDGVKRLLSSATCESRSKAIGRLAIPRMPRHNQ